MSVVRIALFSLIVIAGMLMGYERAAKECNDKGKFENRGSVYSCHKIPAPHGREGMK